MLDIPEKDFFDKVFNVYNKNIFPNSFLESFDHFYYSNKNWEQGDEIPLIEMSDQETSMGGKTLDSIFNNEHNLIYVYDFLLLWTFLIELIEIVENNLNSLYPNLIFAQGEVPEEAPVKSFVSKENLINNDDTLVQDSNIDEDQYC